MTKKISLLSRLPFNIERMQHWVGQTGVLCIAGGIVDGVFGDSSAMLTSIMVAIGIVLICLATYEEKPQ